MFESRQYGIFATLQFIVGFFLFSFSFANTTDKGDQKKASKNLKEDWELLFDDKKYEELKADTSCSPITTIQFTLKT